MTQLVDFDLEQMNFEKIFRPRIIVVDGIIGVGKTMYLGVMEKHLTDRGYKVKLVKEPVEKWKDSGLLAKFYEDQTRWGYTFQTQAFHDRVVENINAFGEVGEATDIYLLERSWFTDTLFMSLLYDSQKITDLEMKSYRDWWLLWHRLVPYVPDLFVYLSTDIDICMSRIKTRGREGELVPKDYQIKLAEKHDAFFRRIENRDQEISSGKADGEIFPPIHTVLDAKCLRVDTRVDFKNDPQVQAMLADDLVAAIESSFTK